MIEDDFKKILDLYLTTNKLDPEQLNKLDPYQSRVISEIRRAFRRIQYQINKLTKEEDECIRQKLRSAD